MKERIIRIGKVEVIDAPSVTDQTPATGVSSGAQLRRPRIPTIAAIALRVLVLVVRVLIVLALATGRVLGAVLHAALRGLDRVSGGGSDPSIRRNRNGG